MTIIRLVPSKRFERFGHVPKKHIFCLKVRKEANGLFCEHAAAALLLRDLFNRTYPSLATSRIFIVLERDASIIMLYSFAHSRLLFIHS